MPDEGMTETGIYDGDTLILDRSVKPVHGHVVLAALDGAYMIRRLYKRGRIVRLIPENEGFAIIEMEEGMELQIWGVVTARIRNFSY